ncbi:MAG TPA: PLP-dependent aminotransferase family protein [Chthoniobacteraceae bacterium]
MRTKLPEESAPLYERVAAQVGKLIDSGTLRPGDRIPSVRRSSRQHGVSVTTAVQAYLELENRGLIEARPKSGFYVRPRLHHALAEPGRSRPALAAHAVGKAELMARIFEAASRPNVVPLGAGVPSEALLPTAKLNRLLASAARNHGVAGINYDMPPGCEPLRRQLARRSLDWGCHLAPEDFIGTCGGTEALLLSLRAVTKPGDIVAVESPSYFGTIQAIESLGLKALEIPTDPRDGLDTDALGAALRRQRVAACVATPNFHNPLGCLMPDDRKRELVELLARREIPLIEDDVYGDTHFEGERPRTLKSFDAKGLVLLCGSFSKTLAPGYRVGWCVPGRFFERVKVLKLTTTMATATLPQLAIAEFLQHGGYDHHLRAIRRTYAEQVQRVSHALAETFPANIKLTRPRGGMFLWIELPRKVDALELFEQALREDISIGPGPLFSAKQQFRNFVRVSCGHPWSAKLERGIGVLGSLVKRAAG